MAQTNTAEPRLKSHEGARSADIAASEQLLRACASTMLFENTYYESGADIANRIAALVRENTPQRVAEVARLCRNELKLRHVPLWLVVQMAIAHKGNGYTRRAVSDVVQRPDELAEVLALYWKAVSDERKSTGHSRVPASLKRGLADAFPKFDEYRLAKWNRTDRAVKLKDVLFLTHPKPKDTAQDELWKRLIAGTLTTPDTWEVALSGGTDKKETWTRLVSERKLGAVATIMNLRNMTEHGVEPEVIRQAIDNIGPRSRLLPFRFATAAEYAPAYAEDLDRALLRSLEGYGKLAGLTVLCIDISGSMSVPLSQRGTVSRAKVSATLGALMREVCEEARVIVFGTDAKEVPNLRGLGLVAKVGQMNEHDEVGSGTNIAKAVNLANQWTPARIIVITDEQGHTMPEATTWRGYVVNCGSYAPGIATSANITRINGFSERILDWVAFDETGKLISTEQAEDAVESTV